MFSQGGSPKPHGPTLDRRVAESIGMRRGGRAESRGPRHFSMIRDFHLADVFTLANGACGTAAIFLAMDHVREAGADRSTRRGAGGRRALFDVLDGRIARWRHKASALGRELDSLADVISFGVAPAASPMRWA